ncbi:universal stress protein [Devosia beringensis]|uniref:universal stress protein n=1 Tax=Devosia beringensis TaxID=2657486 RepID=UPI00186BA39D|nr:universal stress protein [Devosia beringensis]
MQDASSGRTGPRTSGSEKSEVAPGVLVCVDLAHETPELIPPAKAIARALGAELTFVYVIETHGVTENGAPIDPVEWDFKLREAKVHMGRLAQDHTIGDEPPTTDVLEGRSAEQICDILASRPQDIAVLGRGHGSANAAMGETARQVLEGGRNSLLLVPVGITPKQKFSRILVPLDCSGRSERVMPLVEKIARSDGAELVLVHSIPEPVFTGAGPSEPNDSELRSQVNERNERVARSYLDQLCARIRATGLRATSMVFSGGDVRRKLVAAIDEQEIDLLIVASHGHSGFADVPFGDVASFLVKRSSVPTLVIRIGSGIGDKHAFADARSKGPRRPGTLAQ